MLITALLFEMAGAEYNIGLDVFGGDVAGMRGGGVSNMSSHGTIVSVARRLKSVEKHYKSEESSFCSKGIIATRKKNKTIQHYTDCLTDWSSELFPIVKDGKDLEPPFADFEETSRGMSHVLERLRCDDNIRRLYYHLKVALNQFEGPRDSAYFADFEDECFGDKAPVEGESRSFKSRKFDWESFTGVNGQLEGLTIDQKKAIVFRVACYPRQAGMCVAVPVTKVSGRKRKTRSQSQSNNSAPINGATDDPASSNVPTEDQASWNVSVYLAGPKLSYHTPAGKGKAVPVGSVPIGAYCSPVGLKAKRTECLCRFMIFNQNSFVVMLPALYQLQLLRAKMSLTDSMEEIGPYFSAIFGLTNISSHGGSGGTRGFHFFFHIDRNLGTFCHLGMSVLLGDANWAKINACLSDFSRKKGLVQRSAVQAMNIEKDSYQKWVINKASVDASCYIDTIVGYAYYLKDAKRSHHRISNMRILERPPDREDCLRKCTEYGLNAAPVPAAFNTQRKKEYSAAPMDFLKKFDITGGDHWRISGRIPSFMVADPSSAYLFQSSARFVKDTFPQICGRHDVDITAVELKSKASAGVDYLRASFGIFFGPGGLGPNMDDSYQLTADAKVPFVYSFSCGDFGAKLYETFLPGIYYDALTEQLKAAVEKTDSFQDKFPAGSDVTCFGTLSFKVNNRDGFKIHMQLPHVVMSCGKLVKAQKAGCVLVRAIIPIDRAGCVVVVWPSGSDDRGVLVYIPPYVALILPVTIPTSDCPRFTPSGQAHVEIVLAFWSDPSSSGMLDDSERCLPNGIVFEDRDYDYPFCGNFRTKKDQRFVPLDGLQVAQKYPGLALNNFISMFDSMH